VVLGTEEVTLSAGETETVTFDGLDPVPESTVASDEEPVGLTVEANEDSDTNETDLDQPVQSAIEFAGGDGDGPVTVLDGTYEENVVISAGLEGVDDVSGLTVEAPGMQAPKSSTSLTVPRASTTRRYSTRVSTRVTSRPSRYLPTVSRSAVST